MGSRTGRHTQRPGFYRLTAQHADIDGISTAAGARLHQWTPTGRNNQQFEFIDAGDIVGSGQNLDGGIPLL